MYRKEWLFDVMLGELAKFASQKYSNVPPVHGVDELALVKARFIEEMLEQSQLTETELERARAALQNAYIAVEPGYVVGVVHLLHNDIHAHAIEVSQKNMRSKVTPEIRLKDAGSTVTEETKNLLKKKPSLPKNASIVVGDTLADEQLENVLQNLRVRKAKRREGMAQEA